MSGSTLDELADHVRDALSIGALSPTRIALRLRSRIGADFERLLAAALIVARHEIQQNAALKRALREAEEELDVLREDAKWSPTISRGGSA